MVRKQLLRFGVVIVVAGTFTYISIVAHDSWVTERSPADEQLPRGATPTVLAGGGADYLKGVPLMLVAPEGQQLYLYDSPGGALLFTVEMGSLVVIEEARTVAGTQWFLVVLNDSERRGWVPTEGLSVSVTPEVTFDDFRFCPGTAAAPGEPCGRELPIDSEGIWLRWHYKGLKAGDEVQRVLLINGERYQSQPATWDGASTGEQLVNLRAEHAPRMEPGIWVVEFFVNQRLVGETSVWVR